jgi:hypothetical protein
MSGARLYFECENFQTVGAFKIRGAANAVFSLSDEEARRGVATHSSGNHAAALRQAAAWRGIPAHVVMPDNASFAKRNAVQGYGGDIVFCEPTLAAREATVDRLLTPPLKPEDLHAQLPRHEFHRLASQKSQDNLTLARYRPPLAKSRRACQQHLAWGKRGRAKLTHVCHRPVNCNYLLKIVGHGPVLPRHFD